MDERNGHQVKRTFAQTPDFVSFYSDYTQVVGTGHEVMVQFYETIPGLPTGDAKSVRDVATRLRASITVSPKQAANIGELLIKQSKKAASESESQ